MTHQLKSRTRQIYKKKNLSIIIIIIRILKQKKKQTNKQTKRDVIKWRRTNQGKKVKTKFKANEQYRPHRPKIVGFIDVFLVVNSYIYISLCVFVFVIFNSFQFSWFETFLWTPFWNIYQTKKKRKKGEEICFENQIKGKESQEIRRDIWNTYVTIVEFLFVVVVVFPRNQCCCSWVYTAVIDGGNNRQKTKENMVWWFLSKFDVAPIHTLSVSHFPSFFRSHTYTHTNTRWFHDEWTQTQAGNILFITSSFPEKKFRKKQTFFLSNFRILFCFEFCCWK